MDYCIEYLAFGLLVSHDRRPCCTVGEVQWKNYYAKPLDLATLAHSFILLMSM